MKKVAVVYWSQTGNTEAMAEAVAQGAGTQPVEWSDFSSAQVAGYDALAFGCPSMGCEELDPNFEELWDACVPLIGGRPVALFGSYDWGDGEWMRTWREAAQSAGIDVRDAVVAHLDPDDEATAACVELGRSLAE